MFPEILNLNRNMCLYSRLYGFREIPRTGIGAQSLLSRLWKTSCSNSEQKSECHKEFATLLNIFLILEQ